MFWEDLQSVSGCAVWKGTAVGVKIAKRVLLPCVLVMYRDYHETQRTLVCRSVRDMVSRYL